MEFPVIDFSKLETEKRSETMACIMSPSQLEKVKPLVNRHYEEILKGSFYNYEMAKILENNGYISDRDWESAFFIWHRPASNINELTSLSKDLRYRWTNTNQLIKVAEKLSELMCENLCIEKNHIMKAFSGNRGPSVGTKEAIYPRCPRPELIRGLREYTDAGRIILMLQDDQVPGLEFFKDGKWEKIPPSKNNRICVNTGDQTVLHRVMAMKDGNRLSIATFYNPAGDAIISPAPKLLLPNHIRFQDYLNLYTKTKFGDKGLRFQSLKNMASGHPSSPEKTDN
ncbi:hypothetical protein Pfo_003781 [Paulownia fortunei]|nr:hypothetical protein Pfo_003781 [Paulownia fortunei]